VGIQVPLGRLMSYQWQAEFFNNFLPAQVGGDVARGYAVAADTRRTADAAASVVIDRFIGLLVFMLFAAVATAAMLLWGRPNHVPFAPEQLLSLRLIALGSGLVALGLLAVVLMLLSRRLKGLVERLLGRLPLRARTVPMGDALLWVALGSMLIVLLTSLNIWLIARALEPGGISLLEVLVVNPIIVFVALALPLAPGGLGVRLQQALGYIISIPGGILWMRGRGRHDDGRAQDSPGMDTTA